MVDDQEIDVGLVLHLDPDVLEDEGAVYLCSPDLRVRGGHFFLCIAADDSNGEWIPLYENPGPGRVEVPADGRRGHPKWTCGTCHLHIDQIWQASHTAVARAALAGGDLSQAGARNELLNESLQRLLKDARLV